MNEFHDILLSWSPISRLVYPDRDEISLTAVLDCGCGTGIWADEVLAEYDGEVEVSRFKAVTQHIRRSRGGLKLCPLP